MQRERALEKKLEEANAEADAIRARLTKAEAALQVFPWFPIPLIMIYVVFWGFCLHTSPANYQRNGAEIFVAAVIWHKHIRYVYDSEPVRKRVSTLLLDYLMFFMECRACPMRAHMSGI